MMIIVRWFILENIGNWRRRSSKSEQSDEWILLHQKWNWRDVDAKTNHGSKHNIRSRLDDDDGYGPTTIISLIIITHSMLQHDDEQCKDTIENPWTFPNLIHQLKTRQYKTLKKRQQIQKRFCRCFIHVSLYDVSKAKTKTRVLEGKVIAVGYNSLNNYKHLSLLSYVSISAVELMGFN